MGEQPLPSLCRVAPVVTVGAHVIELPAQQVGCLTQPGYLCLKDGRSGLFRPRRAVCHGTIAGTFLAAAGRRVHAMQLGWVYFPVAGPLAADGADAM
jgi:hypothetical protein